MDQSIANENKPTKVKALLYHNLFSELVLPEFTATQANIFVYMLYLLKGMIKDPAKITYYQTNPDEFCISVNAQEALKEFGLKSNNKPSIKKALHTMEDLEGFKFKTTSIDSGTISSSVVFISARYNNNSNSLKVKINPNSEMLPLFRGFANGNFTKFALVDYYALKGIYEKTLFRYLSRFVTSPVFNGKHKVRIQKDKLYELFHIDKDSPYYKSGNIKSTILAKAIKILNSYFKDLTVNCVYNHANFHVYYEFTWTKDLRTKVITPSKKSASPANSSDHDGDYDLTLPF